jgi:hypothetical protein
MQPSTSKLAHATCQGLAPFGPFRPPPTMMALRSSRRHSSAARLKNWSAHMHGTYDAKRTNPTHRPILADTPKSFLVHLRTREARDAEEDEFETGVSTMPESGPAADPTIPTTISPSLHTLLSEFKDVFSESWTCPPTQNVSHPIQVEPGSRPPVRGMYQPRRTGRGRTPTHGAAEARPH